MARSHDDKRKHLILACRFFDGSDTCEYKEKLDAHEVDKTHLPPPECMKDEYTLPDEEVRRLLNACTVWNYEKHWVEASLQGHGDSGCTKEYIDYGNEDFNADDGTPISLKALLWNRYYHWGGWMSDQESFRNWYRKYYVSEPTNREKRAELRKPELIAKCKYYHGETFNPWNFAMSAGFNYWRKTYWHLEKQWVDELSMSYKSFYANHDLLTYWNAVDYFEEKNEPLSLINYILGYHNHVAENCNATLDGVAAIDSYENQYIQLVPLGKGIERYFNFYKGEESNPWSAVHSAKFGVFWQWEQMVYERCKEEGSRWLIDMANESLPHVKIEWLNDDSVPFDFKALCLYVNAMACKWIPWEEAMDINKEYLQGIYVNPLLDDEKNLRRPVFAISRHRMGIDGKGVTTLVAFMGCPLKCKWCLNDKCHEPVYEKDCATPREGIQLLSPYELYDIVKKDNIYFQATGGGICFGGGEPALQSDFIVEFAKLRPKNWKLTIETSLHCSCAAIEALAPYIDEWIIDIKDINGSIYEKYTGVCSQIERQLVCIKACVPLDKVTIKVPLIPDFNTEKDIESSVEYLKDAGFKNIIEVKYVKPVVHINE
mgnify:FL=1